MPKSCSRIVAFLLIPSLLFGMCIPEPKSEGRAFRPVSRFADATNRQALQESLASAHFRPLTSNAASFAVFIALTAFFHLSHAPLMRATPTEQNLAVQDAGDTEQSIEAAILRFLTDESASAWTSILEMARRQPDRVAAALFKANQETSLLEKNQRIDRLVHAGPPELRDAVARMLNSTDYQRWWAFHALAGTGHPSAVSLAFTLLADPLPARQHNGLEFLIREKSHDPRFIEASRKGLDSPVRTTRELSVEGIEASNDRPSIDLLRSHLKDPTMVSDILSVLLHWTELELNNGVVSPQVSAARTIAALLKDPSTSRSIVGSILRSLSKTLATSPRQRAAEALGLDGIARRLFLQSGWLMIGATPAQLDLLESDTPLFKPLLQNAQLKVVYFTRFSKEELTQHWAYNNGGFIVMQQNDHPARSEFKILAHEIGHDIVPLLSAEDRARLKAAYTADPEIFKALYQYRGPTAIDQDYPEQQAFCDLLAAWIYYPEQIFFLKEPSENSTFRTFVEIAATAFIDTTDGRRRIGFSQPTFAPDSRDRVRHADVTLPPGHLDFDALMRLYRTSLPGYRPSPLTLSDSQKILASIHDVFMGSLPGYLPFTRLLFFFNPERFTIRPDLQPYLSDLDRKRNTSSGEFSLRREVVDGLNGKFSYDQLQEQIRLPFEEWVRVEHPDDWANKDYSTHFVFSLMDAIEGGDRIPSRSPDYRKYVNRLLDRLGITKLLENADSPKKAPRRRAARPAFLHVLVAAA